MIPAFRQCGQNFRSLAGSLLVITGLLLPSLLPAETVPLERLSGHSSSSSILKVLLKKDRELIRLSSAAPPKITTVRTGRTLRLSSRAQSRGYMYEITESGGMLVVNGQKTGQKNLFFKPAAQPLGFGKRSFRGAMLLVYTNDTIFLINRVDIDQYLRGVVPCEVDPGWHQEALKVQAVISRTFAYSRRRENRARPHDVDATTRSQVYRGIGAEHKNSDAAVFATAGLVLKHKGRLITAFFHSSCGGHTENSENVWQRALPWLKGKASPYCQDTKYFRWRRFIPAARLRESLGLQGQLRLARILARYPSGRVKRLKLQMSRGRPLYLSGKELRRKLGARVVRSALFSCRSHDGGLLLQGRGWGHGVGLCQWCAARMAVQGFSMEAIVTHFYRAVYIERHRIKVEWP